MTTALEKSVPSRKPRQRPAPSSRDQQIYLDYQVTDQRQIDLAAQYKLTQCRISQIIRRVEAWLTATLDPGPETLDSTARERLERRLQSQRLNEASRLAMQHFHQQQKTVSHKKGTRGGKEFKETTERLLPPNIQCLKVVLQATALQSRLSVRWAVPTTASAEEQPPSDEQRREQVEAWLAQRRDDAARAHKVAWDHNPLVIIQDLVSSLLGEPNQGLALRLLAHEAGHKLVKRKSYDDEPVPIPPQDGGYYAMYSADGGLVGWLNAEQVSHVISPDYPPISRSSSILPNSEESGSAGHGESKVVQPGEGLWKEPPDDSSHSAIRRAPGTGRHSAVIPSPSTTHSTTSPPPNIPPQPAPTPALTAASPPTNFLAPIKVLPANFPAIELQT